MNFHKKIGFLAALLLTFGLGVPDGFAQSGIITLGAPSPSNVTEQGSPDPQPVEISVTLSPAPAPASGNTAAVTVAVTLTAKLAGSTTIATTVANVTSDNNGGNFTVNIPVGSELQDSDDKDSYITLSATAAPDYAPAQVNIIVDDDDSAITFDVAPTSIVEGVETAVTVSSVNLTPNPGASGTAATVDVDVDIKVRGMLVKSTTVSVTAANESTNAVTVTVTVPQDNDGLDEEDGIEVVASKTGYLSGTRSIDITDDDNIKLDLASATLTEANNLSMSTTVSLVVAPTPAAAVSVTVSVTQNGFEIFSQVLTIASGSTSETQNLEIPWVDDAVYSPPKTIIFTADAADYLVSNAVTVTVNDDENPGPPTEISSFTATPTSVNEGGSQDVVLDLAIDSNNSNTDVEITSTNTPGATLASVTLASTATTAEITVSVKPPEDDNLTDDLFNLTATIIGSSPVITESLNLTFVDNDRLTLTLDPESSVNEGGGEQNVGVTVTFSGPTSQPRSVAVAASGTASGSVTVTVPANSTTGSGTLAVTPTNDSVVDTAPATVTATATGPSATATQSLAIRDNDAPPLTLTTNIISVGEGEARDVLVTASVSQAPGSAVAVNLTTATTNPTGASVTVSPTTATITIAAGATSGNATIRIAAANDDNFNDDTWSVTVTGSATGYLDGSTTINIVDNDQFTGTITITANPPSVTEATSGSQNVTLTVKAVLNDIFDDRVHPTGTVNVTVNLEASAGNLSANSVTVSMKKDAKKTPDTVRAQGSKTVTLPVSKSGGNVTVTGTATDYKTGKVTIPIIDRDASHVDGFRVAIVFPDSGKWVGVGNKKVDVEVTRINGIAHPWSAFNRIQVNLKNLRKEGATADIPTGTVYHQLAAEDFKVSENGAVTWKRDGSGSASNSNISYNSGKDALKFELQIINWKGNDIEQKYGQYSGVYAEVTFTRPGFTGKLTNIQTTTPVYTDLGALDGVVDNEQDKYVGDGVRIKIDNKRPFLDVPKRPLPAGNNVEPRDIREKVSVPNVRAGDNGDAKVGDLIRVSVRAKRDGFFWNGARIRLKSSANSDDYGKAKAKDLHTRNFSLSEVTHVDDSNDSLRVSWEVKEGAYKVQLANFLSGVGPQNTNYHPNNLKVKVFVEVKDQAGNWSPSVESREFTLDANSPDITVLYPSADYESFAHTRSTYFTGANTATSPYEKHLNPLRLLFDERIDSLKVFAVGSDTLNLTNQLSFTNTKPIQVYLDSAGTYNTEDLTRAPKKPTGQGGSKIDLAILAQDLVGNVTKVVVPGVTHDAQTPVLPTWFPKNSLVEDNQINKDTRHPVVKLPEKLDSLSVTYSTSSASNIVQVLKDGDGRLSVTDESVQILIGKDFVENKLYTLQIFARDYAGNIAVTPADSSINLRFNPNFVNPKANMFKVSAAHDSVIAGQANKLTIQAVDHSSKQSRDVVVYDNRDADGTKAAEVRITAMDAAGMPVNSVWFHGIGVNDDDHTDGMATLDTKWTLGKRTVYVKSEKTVDYMKVVVEHRNAGAGATSVVKFDGSVDSLAVDAGAFSMFTLEAFEEDSGDEPVDEVWGDFDLKVTPTDAYGNPSLKSFVVAKRADEKSVDSLRVLDTRVGKDGTKRYDDVFVFFSSSFTLEGFSGLALVPVNEGGYTFTPVAPNRPGKKLQISARVDAASLDPGDEQRVIRGSLTLTITRSLSPELTLSVPGMEGDQAGNDVLIPADEGMITVMVAAEGYNPGDMVTFTKGDTAMDPTEADDDGVARLAITMNAAGSVTVSAVRADGRYETDALTITFVEAPPEPDRKSYVDANGDPVYLIYTGDAPPDMTVGTDDFLALVAAFGSSDGDDNYNAQADVNDDGTVNVADYLEFIKSYGRTAAGPATKPLVLLPGINENAEFSLSLGSERVVAGELVAVDVSLANVEALTGYGFALNYETDKFEFVSVAPADEDLLKSTGGETLFHHVVADGQITVANGLYNGTAISGGGDVVRFVFRVLREFEDNARFEIADGLVFDPSQLQNPAVVAGVLELQSTPREFALHQNFPNPFNPDTTIKYDLAESADVTLQIYNVLGQVVRTLVASEAQNAGRYQIRWNGMDDRGVPVSSGIYFYQISADGKFSDVRKLMLLK